MLIEQQQIALVMLWGDWCAFACTESSDTKATFDWGNALGRSKTPLVAAMRAFVASTFGEEVEL